MKCLLSKNSPLCPVSLLGNTIKDLECSQDMLNWWRMCGALIVYRWHSVWQPGWPEKNTGCQAGWVLCALLQGPLQTSLGESWPGEGGQEVPLDRLTLESELAALGEGWATNATFWQRRSFLQASYLSNRVLAMISRRHLGHSLRLRDRGAGFWYDGSQQAPGLGLYPIPGGSQLVFSLPAVPAHPLLPSARVGLL